MDKNLSSIMTAASTQSFKPDVNKVGGNKRSQFSGKSHYWK
jgi:hypothetical protein